MSSGSQPSTGDLPQLVPDGLTPDEHLNEALGLQHPFLIQRPPTEAVRYACVFGNLDASAILQRRSCVID
eukprot:4284745-Karenia_brevis.AAC.1